MSNCKSLVFQHTILCVYQNDQSDSVPSKASSYTPSQPQLASIDRINMLEAHIAEQTAQIAELGTDVAYARGLLVLEYEGKLENLQRKVTSLEADLRRERAKVVALEKEVEEAMKDSIEVEDPPPIVLSMDTP